MWAGPAGDPDCLSGPDVEVVVVEGADGLVALDERPGDDPAVLVGAAGIEGVDVDLAGLALLKLVGSRNQDATLPEQLYVSSCGCREANGELLT